MLAAGTAILGGTFCGLDMLSQHLDLIEASNLFNDL
jgi:hypothetical protein